MSVGLVPILINLFLSRFKTLLPNTKLDSDLMRLVITYSKPVVVFLVALVGK